MEFTQENIIVQLCSEGMEFEGKGQLTEARSIFETAWNRATTNFEKFIAAHYFARHQQTVEEKLEWDKTALQHALLLDDESVKGTLPSLYLNIGKCYEDLNDPGNAKDNYQAAFSFISFLPDNGYGNMIKAGIDNGLNRVAQIR